MEKERREIEVTRRRRGGIKKGDSTLASNHFPMCSPQCGSLRDIMESHREEKREEGDRGGLEDKRESKGERQIQPVISSLSVLHSPEHTKRLTELGREEKGAGGDRGNLVEKKESQNGERAIRPVIWLPRKNGY